MHQKIVNWKLKGTVNGPKYWVSFYTVVLFISWLRKANENSQGHANSGQLVSYESFYMPQLKDKIELDKDYFRWLQTVDNRVITNSTVFYITLSNDRQNTFTQRCILSGRLVFYYSLGKVINGISETGILKYLYLFKFLLITLTDCAEVTPLDKFIWS